jgi:hypothetical protein
MPLTDLYELASPCIVGFMSRMVQAPIGQPPLFPDIIGTGFLVTADGVAATNRHVVEALWNLPTVPGTNERVGGAFIFMVSDDKLGGQVLNLKIRDVAALQGFSSGNDWYGQDVPDVGLVQLEITGMPFLELATEDYALKPGMEIATMGYPLPRGQQQGTLQRKGLDMRRHRQTIEKAFHRVILQYFRKGPAAGLRVIEQPLPHGCAHILYNFNGHRMASM